jgi:dipeptidyl aminopeptidase/acylaminoacyl peptidase
MKLSLRRSLCALVAALILVLSLPMAGCTDLMGGNAANSSASALSPTAQASVDPAATDVPPEQWLADAQTKLPEIIPLEKLFASSENTSPMLSGDGRFILYRHIEPSGADHVLVRDTKTGMEGIVPYPKGTEGVPYFTWSADCQHVLFMIDRSGDENYGIYAVDTFTGKSKTLFSKAGVSAMVVSGDGSDPNAVYFKANDRDVKCFDIYRCDIAKGTNKLVLQNPGNISDWYFDRRGNLRVVVTVDDDGGEHLLLRKPGKKGAKFVQSEWDEILHWSYADADTSGFIAFSLDGNRVFYAESTGRDTSAVMEMDLTTQETKVIEFDPEYDISDVWIDLKMDRVAAVQYYRERSDWKILEKSFGGKFDRLKQIHEGDFHIVSSSADNRYWLVAFDNDTDGCSYYYVDMDTDEDKFLFNQSPVLEGCEFAKMEPIEYTSSDGFKIRGYATFPVGLERKNLPMVLLVHGGPAARDMWGYNTEAQWLANRGYMVLQVNFRGSTGYGKTFLKASDREWGGKMQQDLTDAVNWAVSNGWADKSRIAIMGGSYGGYAALAGAAFTPDLFVCAIDMFGPSSLITLMQSMPDYWKPYWDQKVQNIGDPVADEEFLKSRSPLYSVDRIKIPVLIAQGGNDVRVKTQEADQIVKAMKERGLDVEYMYFPNSGHGFNSESDRLRFYSEAEDFLAEYIGGRTRNSD